LWTRLSSRVQHPGSETPPEPAAGDNGGLKRISHWIGGQVVEGTSGKQGPVYNPATGEQTGAVDLASAAEVDAAV
jgi:hypothetical protein